MTDTPPRSQRVWLLEQECYSVAIATWSAAAAAAVVWLGVRRFTRNRVPR